MISDTERGKEIYKVTIAGSAVNFFLVIIKFLVGFIGNSSAMIADAIHSVSDFVTDIIVLIFVGISAKPVDEGHDYGHGKYETLATALVGVILFGVGIGVCYHGAHSVYDHYVNGVELTAPSMITLWVAILSIIMKEALFHYTIHKGKSLNSQVVMANAWHHRSDSLSSIGVAIGIGGALLLGPAWRVLDPIAAVVVSIFIIKVSIELLLPCVGELLEKSLPSEIEEQIIETILSVDGVSEPHNLRTRKIGNYSSIDVHVRMDGQTPLYEAHDTITKVEHKLKDQFGQQTMVNIHFEPTK